MLKGWVLFVSSRYIRAGRKARKLSPGLLSAAGIAVGVMALITVISVMNGFQMGFIEDILEISSAHIRITDVEKEDVEKIRKISGIKSAMPFYETKTLLNSRYSIEPCLVKGLPVDAESVDPGFFSQLNIFSGYYMPENNRGLVIGRILMNKLGLNIGDTVSIVALNGGTFKNLRPETTEFIITGVFGSGYGDFDSALVLITEEALRDIDETAVLKLSVKLENRFRDHKAIADIVEASGLSRKNVVSWRIYNRALFSALRLEKTVMFLLLGLIFLVVSFGIFNSTRRTIAEKQEEVGILRAIGSTPSQIRQIFVIDGLIIGVSGGLIGSAAGLLISKNVNSILRVLSVNSSFLVNVPVRIVMSEVFIIFLAAVAFCFLSAFAASSKISAITPQQVLRYE